jgi:hypothetical protein
VIYASLIGIPIVLLVMHMLMVLLQPSVESGDRVQAPARRSG